MSIKDVREKTRNTVRCAICCAVILLWGLTYGWVPGLASITLTHIPVLICCMLFGLKEALIFGTCFGLVSFIRCFITPDVFANVVLGTSANNFGPLNVLYIVLLIFLPRIFAALFAYLVYSAFARIKNRTVGSFVGSGIGAAIGSLTNTVLFLGGFYLVCGKQLAAVAHEAGFISEATMKALLACLLGDAGTNGVLEAVIAVVVCVAAVFPLRRILKIDSAK